jgi:Ca2+-binding RTX toxin-like protein
LGGGGGDDRILGGGGHDSLDGGDGADRLEGQGGADLMSGGLGADLLLGGRDDDNISGGEGNDTLQGGDGADALFGGAGDDLLAGGRGADFFRPEGGDDTVIFGSDAADSALFFYYGPDPGNESIGSDVVRGFDAAAHRIEIGAYADLPDGRLAAIDTRDFLDSNDDGRIDAADAEVARNGNDLVLDLDAVFRRAFGGGEFGTQEITFEGAGAGIAVSRVQAIPEPHTTYDIPVVTEDGILEPPVPGPDHIA